MYYYVGVSPNNKKYKLNTVITVKATGATLISNPPNICTSTGT